METKDIKRIFVENTIRMHFKSYDQDPQRTIRRMIDMGHRFTKSRVQADRFAVISKLFEDENSPYYEAVDKLMQGVNRSTLMHFGLNLGYNSWKNGTHQINRYEQASGKVISWIIDIDINAANYTKYTPENVSKMINHFNIRGVYIFSLHISDIPECTMIELLSAIAEHSSSNFVLFTDGELLSDELYDMLKALTNVAVIVPMDVPRATTETMTELKLLWGHSADMPADTTDIREWVHAMTELADSSASPLLILRNTVREDTDEAVNTDYELFSELRYSMSHPVLLISYSGDLQKINRIISGENIPLAAARA